MKNTVRNHLMASLFAVSLLTCSFGFAEEMSAGNWQINSLLSPSNAQLASERRGRVTIYDSLREETVDQALDQQFGRIENMMFVSTRYTADDGSEYADDDCD